MHHQSLTEECCGVLLGYVFSRSPAREILKLFFKDDSEVSRLCEKSYWASCGI
jgi:hypothetical protein